MASTVYRYKATVSPIHGGGFLIVVVSSPGTSSEEVVFSDATQITVAAALAAWEAIEDLDSGNYVRTHLLGTAAGNATVATNVWNTAGGFFAVSNLSGVTKPIIASVNDRAAGISQAITVQTNGQSAPTSAQADYYYQT